MLNYYIDFWSIKNWNATDFFSLILIHVGEVTYSHVKRNSKERICHQQSSASIYSFFYSFIHCCQFLTLWVDFIKRKIKWHNDFVRGIDVKKLYFCSSDLYVKVNDKTKDHTNVLETLTVSWDSSLLKFGCMFIKTATMQWSWKVSVWRFWLTKFIRTPKSCYGFLYILVFGLTELRKSTKMTDKFEIFSLSLTMSYCILTYFLPSGEKRMALYGSWVQDLYAVNADVYDSFVKEISNSSNHKAKVSPLCSKCWCLRQLRQRNIKFFQSQGQSKSSTQ